MAWKGKGKGKCKGKHKHWKGWSFGVGVPEGTESVAQKFLRHQEVYHGVSCLLHYQ